MPYPYAVTLPELVDRAHRRAEQIGFPLMADGRPIGGPTTAITPMDGALLRCLAAGYPSGSIGEIGTGPGVSTAWLLSGMGTRARLISCEVDRTLADGAAAFFATWPNVEIRAGEWEHLLPSAGPFDLLFFDANAQQVLSQRQTWDRVVDLLTIGGTIMMDDLVPIEMWPAEWRGMTDYKREFCLCNSRIAGAEVRTSPRTVSVVGTRLY
jgi:predicted O-methyltransferase YrrM